MSISSTKGKPSNIPSPRRASRRFPGRAFLVESVKVSTVGLSARYRGTSVKSRNSAPLSLGSVFSWPGGCGRGAQRPPTVCERKLAGSSVGRSFILFGRFPLMLAGCYKFGGFISFLITRSKIK
jgi:hypothetical protein